MYNHPLLQDSFLKELCQEKMAISIFLVNGIKLHGVLESFDEHVLMLKNTITQMVYKHAISTVVPSKLIQYSASEDGKNVPN